MAVETKKNKRGQKLGASWVQRDRYLKSLIPLLNETYGTVEHMAQVNGIHYLTAKKFMQSPGRLRADLAVKLFRALGVEPCDYERIIGEGDE